MSANFTEHCNNYLLKTFLRKLNTPMKIKNILLSLLTGLIIFSGCKKDDVQNTDPTVKVNADGSLNASDADGAFYTVVMKEFDTNTSSSYEEIQMAYAWTGKFPAIVDAGIVKANNIPIDNLGNFYMSVAVLSFSDTLFKGPGYNTVWNVQGNPGAGVPAFTHTDNTALPAAPAFTLPAAVNINNNLTVNHTPTGGALGVLYTLTGDNGDTTKYVANSSSSVTFTSAEIKSVARSNGRIVLAIMPITFNTATYGGKKYYFVKQYQYFRETATL